MPNIKIATWNVNSLRVRLPHMTRWLQDVQPDVLALQETKLNDPDFPVEEIKSLGYDVVFSGQKAYNGVAIISRDKIENVVVAFPDSEDPQKRLLCVTTCGIRLLNLYVPNGQHVTSQKYTYKLQWLEQLNLFLNSELINHPKMVIVGDFNIAPEEIDIHDPQQWLGQVLFSDPERAAFRTILSAGFDDCFRKHCPDDKEFSWWDYRLNAFKRNLGARIDHILASKQIVENCIRCVIDKAPRAWERPSDHAPVLAEFVF